MSCPDHTIRTKLVISIEPSDINDVEVTLDGTELAVEVSGGPGTYTITIPGSEINELGTLNIKEGSTVLACRTIVQ